MKRATRSSMKPGSRRRRVRRRSAGCVLTFVPTGEINAAVLYTDADAYSDTRAYPDERGSGRAHDLTASCAIESF